MKNIFAWLQISCQEGVNQDSSIFIAIAQQLNSGENSKGSFGHLFSLYY